MMAEVKGHDVLIYAYDADMFQLVTDKCHVVTPKEEVTPATVKSRYGIDPRQITDYKALIGDPSDNIPRFIGEKTASALLCEFGTIDGIYQALSPSFDSPVLNIRPNIISILNENERAIRLNLKLTTIVRNIPIMFSQTSHYLNDERVYAFLKKMEFQQLQGRYAKWRMFDK
jgi:DNA polymerase-1